eukprot:g47242.t1
MQDKRAVLVVVGHDRRYSTPADVLVSPQRVCFLLGLQLRSSALVGSGSGWLEWRRRTLNKISSKVATSAAKLACQAVAAKFAGIRSGA